PDDFRYIERTCGFDKSVDDHPQHGAISEHRRDILEEDAGLGEVRHVADGFAEEFEVGRSHGDWVDSNFPGFRLRFMKTEGIAIFLPVFSSISFSAPAGKS